MRTAEKTRMPDYVTIGMAVVLIGFAVVIVAMVASAGAGGKGERSGVRGGGVIMIGPIPIVFGSDPRWASVAIVLAIVLIIVAVLAGWLI
jgi:uncharacterized protein (TIGR00304 family)